MVAFLLSELSKRVTEDYCSCNLTIRCDNPSSIAHLFECATSYERYVILRELISIGRECTSFIHFYSV